MAIRTLPTTRCAPPGSRLRATSMSKCSACAKASGHRSTSRASGSTRATMTPSSAWSNHRHRPRPRRRAWSSTLATRARTSLHGSAAMDHLAFLATDLPDMRWRLRRGRPGFSRTHGAEYRPAPAVRRRPVRRRSSSTIRPKKPGNTEPTHERAAERKGPRARRWSVGGSLGGLFAANLLLRAGWDVACYERVADELESRGAGVVTHPELMEVLSAAGVDVTDGIGVDGGERITWARDGQVEDARPAAAAHRLGPPVSGAAPCLPVERYHNGRQLASFEQDAAVCATFADGDVVAADLLVAADGLPLHRAPVAAARARPQLCRLSCMARTRTRKRAFSNAAGRAFSYFAFGLPPREQMIAYPVAGQGNSAAPGKRRYNFVWYRPADQDTTFREMLTDATGKTWPDGIPPPLIRPEVLAAARQAAHEVLAPQFAGGGEDDQPVLPAGSSISRARRWPSAGWRCWATPPSVRPAALREWASLGAGAAMPRRWFVRSRKSPRCAVRAAGLRRGLGASPPVASSSTTPARWVPTCMAQISTPAEREMAERYRSTPRPMLRETAVPPVPH